jgi:hypothetical protein
VVAIIKKIVEVKAFAMFTKHRNENAPRAMVSRNRVNVRLELTRKTQVVHILCVRWVIALEGCENTRFYLARISIFLHSSNDLDGTMPTSFPIITLDHFAKRPLSE